VRIATGPSVQGKIQGTGRDILRKISTK